MTQQERRELKQWLKKMPKRLTKKEKADLLGQKVSHPNPLKELLRMIGANDGKIKL
jgi:hypothetical protein